MARTILGAMAIGGGTSRINVTHELGDRNGS